MIFSYSLWLISLGMALVEGYMRSRYGPSRTSVAGMEQSVTLLHMNSVSPNDIKRLDALTTKISDYASKTWWGNGQNEVNFDCTGCGKCCTNDGEVWMNTDEFADLVMHLKQTKREDEIQDILEKYVADYMPGWAKLKNKDIVQENGLKTDGCVFLDDEGKHCTIYSARPVQCRTYPWWPRLLHNESTWNAEALPEGESWTPERGGCEGVNSKDLDKSKQSPTVIHRNKALYEYYTDAFPFMRGKEDGGESDRSRLLSKVSLIQAIVKSTKAWVKDFVVKYSLCPFAESVFDDERISYRVYFNGVRENNPDDIAMLIDRVKFEMLDLLSQKEEDVSTTLLMLPFAFSSFQEWNAFTIQLEDAVMPLLEREVRGPLPMGSSEGGRQEKNGQAEKKQRRSLLQKVKGRPVSPSSPTSQRSSSPSSSSSSTSSARKCPVDHASSSPSSSSSQGSVVPLPDIQLAFFHPLFAWADSDDFNAPLNFEKRAPFPTINLLRAARVREYADEKKTTKIAGDNVRALSSAENIVEEFEDIIRIALTA